MPRPKTAIHEPDDLSDEQKRRIVEAHRYKLNGGGISCGHDFHDRAATAQPGDVLLCTRCYQYFVIMSALPWWKDMDNPYRCHIDRDSGIWFHPVDIRVQDKYGNDVLPDSFTG